jgi:hypothetical protein
MEQNVRQMMAAGLGSVELPIQHAGERGQRQPFIGTIRMRQYRADPMPGKPLRDIGIFIHIDIIVVVKEVISHGLAEDQPYQQRQKNADPESQSAIGLSAFFIHPSAFVGWSSHRLDGWKVYSALT